MLNNRNILHKLICLLAITLVMPSSFVFAQKKGTKPVASKCSGAWTGTVTYTRYQFTKNEKTTTRVTNGTDENETTFKQDYKAQILVTDGTVMGKNAAKANVDSLLSMREKTVSKERNSCDRGKTWKDMSGTFTNRTEIEGRGTTDASVSVGINEDGTYAVSVGISRVDGKSSGSRKATYQGQCTAKPGKTETFPDVPATVEGNSITSDGKHRVDAKMPNAVAGTYTLRVGDLVEKVTWNLQKCGPPLRITGIKLYTPVYPDPNDWGELTTDLHSVTDGNFVKVVATVANFSGDTKTANLKFKELKENKVLQGGEKSVSVDPRTEEEVELVWDTSGYAWKGEGESAMPEMLRQIEVSMPENTETKEIKVVPKPIVSVRGLWTRPADHNKFIDFFKAVPGTKWIAGTTGVDKLKAAIDNAQKVDQIVRAVQTEYNAWHVDMTAHSTGGLAARAYINGLMPAQFDGRPTVSHLVMIGTPNKGTPCVVGFGGLFGRILNKNADAYTELEPGNMKKFNLMVKNKNGVKFTTIAGTYYNKTCQSARPGDSLVENGSAVFSSKDRVFTMRPFTHAGMIGDVGNFKEVYKRLAIGPNGNHNPDVDGYIGGPVPGMAAVERDEALFSHRNYGAAYNADREQTAPDQADDDPAAEKAPIFSTAMKVQPKSSQEIAVPVKKGARLVLNFIAPPNVSVTLIKPDGTVAGQNMAGTPDADADFRTIYVETPVTDGTWKLKIESLEDAESEFALVVFVDDVALPGVTK